MSHSTAGDARNLPGNLALAQTVRIHAKDIADLPPPEEEWRFREVDLDKSVYMQFQVKDIVYKTQDLHGDEASVWSVNERAYALASAIMEKPGRLSCCGASGITNDGGTIRCKRCDVVVPQEEIDRVFGQ